MSALFYDALVSDGVPRGTELRMPDGSSLVSSPVSSTLICGERRCAGGPSTRRDSEIHEIYPIPPIR